MTSLPAYRTWDMGHGTWDMGHAGNRTC